MYAESGVRGYGVDYREALRGTDSRVGHASAVGDEVLSPLERARQVGVFLQLGRVVERKGLLIPDPHFSFVICSGIFFSRRAVESSGFYVVGAQNGAPFFVLRSRWILFLFVYNGTMEMDVVFKRRVLGVVMSSLGGVCCRCGNIF